MRVGPQMAPEAGKGSNHTQCCQRWGCFWRLCLPTACLECPWPCPATSLGPL